MEKKRSLSMDILRIAASIGVIGIHFLGTLREGVPAICPVIIEEIVRISLPLFFLLSSLSLANSAQYVGNLKRYYADKFFSIIIPFLLFSVVYYFVSHEIPINAITPYRFLTEVCRALKSTVLQSQYYHLWYVYTLIGLYLFLPFLKVLLQDLTQKQCAVLLIICLIVRTLRCYSLAAIGEYGITGWCVYYLLGYYFLKYRSKTNSIVLYSLGIACFMVSLCLLRYHPDSRWCNNIFDVSPIMMIQTCAVFVFFLNLDDHIRGGRDKLRAAVKFIASQTYIVYLFHPYVKYMLESEGIPDLFNNCYVRFFCSVAITFVLSLLGALLFNAIILKPIKTAASLFLPCLKKPQTDTAHADAGTM